MKPFSKHVTNVLTGAQNSFSRIVSTDRSYAILLHTILTDIILNWDDISYLDRFLFLTAATWLFHLNCFFANVERNNMLIWSNFMRVLKRQKKHRNTF